MTGVLVGRGVFVAGGAVTVNDPLFRVRGTIAGVGSEATALLSDRLEVPGAALGATLKETVARDPSPIGVFPP